MRFKETTCLAVVLSFLSSAVLLCSVGCSDYLRGKKAEPEVLNFSTDRMACLRDVPEQLKKLSVGDATDSTVRASFDCLRDALIYFKNKTYGSVQGAYTTDEMRNFFAKYFLKENKITPDLAGQLMKIKRALLGGSEVYVTKEEIVHLVDLLAVVRDEAVELSPHIKTLFNQVPSENKDWTKISTAIEKLRLTLQRLMDKTQLAGSDYSFEDFKSVLAGLNDFLRGSEPFAPYENIKNWVPLMESVKNVLIGRHAQLNRSYQWRDSLDTIVNLYGLILKYQNVIGDLKFDNPKDLSQFTLFIDQSLSLIEQSQQMKAQGYIPAEDIDELIHQVTPLLKFKFTLRESTLKGIYRIAVMRMLSPERHGDFRGFQGLEMKHMAALRREFNIWRLNQNFVDSLSWSSEVNAKIPQADLLKAYGSFKIDEVIAKNLTDNPIEEMALSQAWLDYGDLLKSPILVNFNKKGRIIESLSPGSYGVSWRSLTKGNLMRALARLLMIGYADNTGANGGRLAGATISKAGLIAWYDEFNDLGLDVKAFDPRTANAGNRSFLEASFFTFSGDGDSGMSLRETYEFVSLLFSAGLATSSDISLDMKACETSDLDVFGAHYLREDCFKKQLRKNANYYFDNLPWMAEYMQKLSDRDFEEFYGYLKSASLTVDQRPQTVETANIRTMVMILHYVESIMVIYDRDGNSTLSLSEVYSAAPRFMSFFKTVSPVQVDLIVKEGFAYLVFNGTMPGAMDLAGFQVGKYFKQEATRKDILRLFGTLREQLSQGQK